MRPSWTAGIVMIVALSSATRSAVGAQDSTVRRLPPMVTVTRDVGRSPLDLPYAVTSLHPDSAAPGQSHTLIDQTLALLPGVTIANRTNPSQDARLSIRGFGARSAFGVRSVRILRDGIPVTLPDGQTPVDYLDLESVGTVEVIRGAASSLYGNASGGVIDIRSASPPEHPLMIQGRSLMGSDEFRRNAALLAGTIGSTAYQANVGRTSAGGYRDHSRQRLTNGFLRITTKLGATDVAVDAMGLDMPLAENPGALTLAQVDSGVRSADPAAIRKHARKEVRQSQLGLTARRSLPAGGEIAIHAYDGTRSLYNPLTYAVVGVDRHSGGTGGRLTYPVRLGPFVDRISVGAEGQWLDDARRNWVNCNGVTTINASCRDLSVEKGSLQLDQRELVSSVGSFIRNELEVGAVRGTIGVRADAIRFEVRDRYFGDGRDDSGIRTMHALSPMLGFAARLSPFHALYANVATAFETPTTTELGNQSDGGAGLNRDLEPQFSTTYELGMKGLALSRLQYDVTAFDTHVRDELISFEIPNGSGRTYFRNAGRTQRRGVEAAAATDVGALSIAASYAWSHFRFRDFTVGTTQYAGKAIPGIPEEQMQATMTWRVKSGFVVAEGQGKSRVFVNDANAAVAPSFVTFNARAGARVSLGRSSLNPVVGVQNLFDRHFIGSVAVNAAGTVSTAKFYEPAPGRTWIVGLSAATGSW